MNKINVLLLSASIMMITSCGSPVNKGGSDTKTIYKSIDKSTVDNSTIFVTSKFVPFNNIDDIRLKLSSVGIGDLNRWEIDEVGDYASFTSYYKFGEGYNPNNLAYYLESNNANSIKTLALVLNINNGNTASALIKFAATINKTYKALGLIPTKQVMNAAKNGKEVKVNVETHIEQIKLEKSRIETWKFIIETK